jgi:hypothetical protein
MNRSAKGLISQPEMPAQSAAHITTATQSRHALLLVSIFSSAGQHPKKPRSDRVAAALQPALQITIKTMRVIETEGIVTAVVVRRT